MSIIDLNTRHTKDYSVYEANRESLHSFIYVDNNVQFDKSSEDILILTVGSDYEKNAQKISIPTKGIVVKPGQSIVLHTEQKIALPQNVMGLITGLGCNIFNGGFISSGKIDQGFRGVLKVGYYNGSSQKVTFKKGSIIACAIFFTSEATHSAQGIESPYDNAPSYSTNIRHRIIQFFCDNWVAIISLLVAVIGLFIPGGGQ